MKTSAIKSHVSRVVLFMVVVLVSNYLWSAGNVTTCIAANVASCYVLML